MTQIRSLSIISTYPYVKLGEVAEWLKAAVLKTVKDASPSRVRISASPFYFAQMFSRLSFEGTGFCEAAT